jgi:acylphosphatase
MDDLEAGQRLLRMRLRVRGRVQGVWFRGWTREQALALGLSGFAKNREDGSVEVLAEGPAASVEALLAACRRGPPSARVEAVCHDVEVARGELGGFRIL